MGAYLARYMNYMNYGEPPTKKRKLSDGNSVPGGDYGYWERRCQEKEQYIDRLQSEHKRFKTTHKDEYNDLKRKYHEEKNAKDEAVRRLSAMASSKLRDNNPNIADLSDQNRPTKIAEKMSELYDNQWTNAFDALGKRMNETDSIKFLKDLLMHSYKECWTIACRNYFEKVQRYIELPLPNQGRMIPTSASSLPDQLKQQIKEFRKSRAVYMIKDVEKAIKDNLTSPHNNLEEVRKYISGCVEVAWLMVVQDPALVLSATSPSKFDKNIFKEYTKRGPYVDYVVWPALFLHEGGAVLAKGVAQGRDHPPRRH